MKEELGPEKLEVERKHRKCLRCTRKFMSLGPENRICNRCKIIISEIKSGTHPSLDFIEASG